VFYEGIAGRELEFSSDTHALGGIFGIRKAGGRSGAALEKPVDPLLLRTLRAPGTIATRRSSGADSATTPTVIAKHRLHALSVYRGCSRGIAIASRG